MTNINLLPQEERANESFERLRQKLSIASIAVLAVAAALTLGTLIFYSVLGRARAQLLRDHEDNAARINELKAVEDKIVVVKDKMKLANSVITTRTDMSDVFNKIAALVPQGVYFSDIKIAANKVSVTGKARTSTDIAGFVSALTSSAGSNVLKGISINSLSSDKSGVYSFSLDADLVTANTTASAEGSAQ